MVVARPSRSCCQSPLHMSGGFFRGHFQALWLFAALSLWFPPRVCAEKPSPVLIGFCPMGDIYSVSCSLEKPIEMYPFYFSFKKEKAARENTPATPSVLR